MISAVVLTHHDSATLARTLDGLAWCDERIIVDDYSTDETLAIAGEYTTRVYRRHLHGDFAAQRNFGLSKAKGEWVLFVDSDEAVPPQLAKEIRQKVYSLQFRVYRGFIVRRQDWFMGRWLKHGEAANIKLLRLAKKDAGRWARPVHEVWDVKGPVGRLSAPLLHYPHPDVAQFLDEINSYSTLNAHFLKKKNIHAAWWHILVYPTAKFFVNFIQRRGFLDGMPGAIMAIMMSFHSFLTRAKLWHLWHKRIV